MLLLVTLFWPSRRQERKPTVQEQVNSRPHGSFPLPPMDLQVPPSPRTKRVVAEREPANIAGSDSREV